MVGNPVQSARVYNSRGVDELVFLDIFASKQSRKLNLKVVAEVIKECFMPVAIGGGISTLEDINDLLKIGADKVVIKQKAIESPGFIEEAVKFFGSQCITISVDVRAQDGDYYIHNTLGKEIRMDDFMSQMNALDVGEYVITNTDRDGMMAGFDLDMINAASDITNKPIIAVGGAGTPEHFLELFQNTNIEAVGSASIYHFTRYTPQDVKHHLHDEGINVRL